MSWLELAEWDWVAVGNGGKLHAVARQPRPTVDDDDVGAEGLTMCHRRGWLRIPGPFSRLNVARCRLCCERTGMPQGVGSPKNSQECRPVVEARLRELVA